MSMNVMVQHIPVARFGPGQDCEGRQVVLSTSPPFTFSVWALWLSLDISPA